MSKLTPPPVIGEALYRQLAELAAAARSQATAGRDFHAAALYVVLEAMRVQAEHAGTHVTVLLQPVKP